MLKRVEIKNYKSIAQAVVDLNQFTVLVGPNGAGKSNFLDALSFVTDALVHNSVQYALNARGGFHAVRWRESPRGRPRSLSMRFDIDFGEGTTSTYMFEICSERKNSIRVRKEECFTSKGLLDRASPNFTGENGTIRLENTGFPNDRKTTELGMIPDCLALPLLGRLPEFNPTYRFLSQMRFYSIAPGRVREPQKPDDGFDLNRDGSNAASVIRALQSDRDRGSYSYRVICEFLSKMVPGVEKVEPKAMGSLETISFKQNTGGQEPVDFEALNMSDGTLRILGVLLAMHQCSSPSVVGIEEPESTVHPAASEALMDVLLEGSHRSQVLITTHSPEILDNKELRLEDMRAVEWNNGKTMIGPISEATKKVVREGLCTLGELLSADEIEIDKEPPDEAMRQLGLFEKTTQAR